MAMWRPLSNAIPIDKKTTQTIKIRDASSIHANRLAYWGVISLTITFKPYRPIIETVKKTIIKLINLNQNKRIKLTESTIKFSKKFHSKNIFKKWDDLILK